MKRRDFVIIVEGLLKIDDNRKLHISVCFDGFYKFYNGTCLSYDNKSYVEFYDMKLGNIIIPYSQIINIEPMIQK